MSVTNGANAITLAGFAAEHGVALTRFAYVVCGDRGQAEDLVQDAFLALYRRFGADLPVAAPVAYARRAIVNDWISRRRRRSSGELPMAELPDRATEDRAPDERDAMWRALRELPERQRAVLALRYYADLPDPEIARAMGCREGSVRSLAARAFATLRLTFATTDEAPR